MFAKFLALVAIASIAVPAVSFAQSPFPGNDADLGVTAAGFPNAYTGNVSFSTRDMVIAGAVGERGLSWRRYASSRSSEAESYFGLGHNWTHNWQWEMADAGTDSSGRRVISVYKPDGTVSRYTQTSPTQWWAGPFAREHIISTGDRYVVRHRGGDEARFLRQRTSSGAVFIPYEICDSRGNVWKLAYADGHLVEVREPAGRWFRLSYEVLTAPDSRAFTVISAVKASDGQTTAYKYEFPHGTNYPVLTEVSYPDANVATYKYSQDRPNTRLLLAEADDPRGDRNLRGRTFRYRSEPDAASGQLLAIYATGSKAVMHALESDGGDLRRRAITQPNGTVTYSSFNPGGSISESIDALGFARKYAYTQNGRGLLEELTDELGSKTRYEYNSAGDLTRTIHADGSSLSSEYDAVGRVISVTNELGASHRFTLDDKGRLARLQHPDGAVDEMTYNELGQMSSKKDRAGGLSVFQHDSRGLRISATDALGNVMRATYDPSGRMASVIDANGKVTSFERNAMGLITKTTYPDGTRATVTYDRFGDVVKETEGNDVIRVTRYDSFGRVASRVDAEGHEVRHKYSVVGQSGRFDLPSERLTASGYRALMAFDANGRVSSITEAAGTPSAVRTQFAYDPVGRKIGVTTPAGRSVTFSYDSRGRKIAERTALNHATTYAYDAAGRKISETDASGNKVLWTYDREDREISKTDAGNQVSTRTYDPSGRLAMIVDPKKNTYKYTYDVLGRMTFLEYPDKSKETTSYNAVGRVKTFTNRAGAVRRISYDKRDREIFSDWSDHSQKLVKEYDKRGRLTTVENQISKLTYTYDKNSRMLSETQDVFPLPGGTSDPAPRTVRYAYTADGDRDHIVYPDGTRVAFKYSPRSQLQAISLDSIPTPIARYEYDLAGNATRMPRENNTESTRNYDADNRVTQIVESGPQRNSFSQRNYTYDEVGNRVAETEAVGSQRTQYEYEYDNTHQLIKAQTDRPNLTQDGSPSGNTLFTFDSVGNRLQVSEDGHVVRLATNQLNQYERVNNFAPTHDRNGNLASMDEWLYRYDALSRLAEVSDGSVTARFYYDGRNRVVARSYNGKISFNVYDDWNLIEERNGSDVWQARYIHGREVDEVVTMMNRIGVFYPHHDAVGNVTMLTDAGGRLVERYSYTTSGEVKITDATGKILRSSSVGNRWTFTGRELLPEVGLYDYRNRVYSAKLGRFMQTDPLRFGGGDINLYRYAYNNPTRFRDPDGLEVRVYSSDAFGFPGANHAFTWSTAEGRGVGRTGSSGYVRGSGVPDDFNPATSTYAYNVVPNLNGRTEGQVIDSIRNNPSLDDGLWFPYANDCHTDLRDSFNDMGINYPGAPNGRFDLDDWFVQELNNVWDSFWGTIKRWIGE